MRANANLFWILTGFFFAADITYVIWNIVLFNDQSDSALNPTRPIEWVGTVAIALAALLSLLIAFYLTIARRAQGGELPEDRLDANIDDGEAEQGHFSPWSWWPLVLAASAALTFLGIAIGPWVAFIGVAIFLVAIVGWVYEYYRGYFAR